MTQSRDNWCFKCHTYCGNACSMCKSTRNSTESPERKKKQWLVSCQKTPFRKCWNINISVYLARVPVELTLTQHNGHRFVLVQCENTLTGVNRCFKILDSYPHAQGMVLTDLWLSWIFFSWPNSVITRHGLNSFNTMLSNLIRIN